MLIITGDIWLGEYKVKDQTSTYFFRWFRRYYSGELKIELKKLLRYTSDDLDGDINGHKLNRAFIGDYLIEVMIDE